MEEVRVTVFNNYYFSLLKKLKDIARVDKNRDSYRACIKAIKAHYHSYDKSSDEYKVYYQSVIGDNLLFGNAEQGKEWLDSRGDVQMYKDISVRLAREILGDDGMFLYFMVGMHTAVSDDIDIQKFTDIAGSIKTQDIFEKSVQELEPESVIRKQLELMSSLYRASIKTGIDEGLSDIENTSLGKLAKEIMNEVDVSKLTETLDNDGDILKTLGNPDSGLTKLLGTVSQKLISKMASGEINNETLIKDALEFSSKMGGRGAMAGMPDMSGMMSMFQGMMKGEAAAGAAAGGGHHRNYQVDRSAVSRVAKAKQLKRKLDEKKKKAKENVSDV